VLGTRPDDVEKLIHRRAPNDPYPLPKLKRDDFVLMLQRSNVTLSTSQVDELHKVLQANALFLDLAAKELALAAKELPQAPDTSLQTIIQRVSNNPTDIFSIAIDRLKVKESLWQKIIKPILGVLLVTQQPLG